MLTGSYDVTMRLLRWASPIVSRGPSKLAVGVTGRRHALQSLRSWAEMGRDRTHPLVWMHAPSVGEGLQAKAVLQALVETRPLLQSLYTFFSPSAVDFAKAFPSDISAYLPWDVGSELNDLLRQLDPRLVSFTKTEVWPGLTGAAASIGIPVVLCAATLSRAAGRLRPGVRQFLRPTFGSLSRVLAIAQEDGERFLSLGVSSDSIEVTGDPGIDSAWIRARSAAPETAYLAPFLNSDDRPTLVAGSTWKADEEVLLPTLRQLKESLPRFRAIIAPHEPRETHLGRLEKMARDEGLTTDRLGEVQARGDDKGADVVLVDSVGLLAHLYTVGSVAYVGGGFGRGGLHSVLEPAAAGLPVVFGPRHRGSRSARELIQVSGATSVTGGTDLSSTLRALMESADLRGETGANALGYIERHRGAAQRTAQILAGFLPARAVEPRG